MSAPTRTARSPPPYAASCSATARCSTSTTGCSRSRRPPPKIKQLVPEARVATAHGQMGEHQLEQVMLDFWEKRFDVLVCTTIVESGPRRLQRQHDDHRALRHPRPLPAAPAARPGRPLPRARLRLLPLPAGQAAHRDRARAAGHPGPALRPRRRHGDRDEGPRDPRRRQPARRRAVRPHRRRRLRPLRAAGRRGGLGVPPGRRRASSSRSRSRSSCRSTRTCRTTTSAASGSGWRCTSGWPRCAPTTTSRLLHEELLDRYGTAARAGRAAARRRQLPGPSPRRRALRGHRAGQVRALPPGRAARLARRTPGPASPEKPRTRPPCVPCWCRGHSRPASVRSRLATRSCSPGPDR